MIFNEKIFEEQKIIDNYLIKKNNMIKFLKGENIFHDIFYKISLIDYISDIYLNKDNTPSFKIGIADYVYDVYFKFETKEEAELVWNYLFNVISGDCNE